MEKYLELIKKGFDERQINQIIKGLEQGIDISQQADPTMSLDEIRQLRIGQIKNLQYIKSDTMLNFLLDYDDLSCGSSPFTDVDIDLFAVSLDSDKKTNMDRIVYFNNINSRGMRLTIDDNIEIDLNEINENTKEILLFASVYNDENTFHTLSDVKDLHAKIIINGKIISETIQNIKDPKQTILLHRIFKDSDNNWNLSVNNILYDERINDILIKYT